MLARPGRQRRPTSCVASGLEAAQLASALAALAPQIKGDQADLLANRIVDLLAKASVLEAAQLGDALTELAPQMNGSHLGLSLSKLIELRQGFRCGNFANERL